MLRTAQRSVAVLPLTLTLAIAMASCGGGVTHIGDITPVVQERVSGAWTLNPEESDDPQEAMAAARPREGSGARRPGGGVTGGGGAMPPGGAGRPGAGGRGGMTGAGGRGAMPGAGGRGGMQGRAGRADPETMRAAMRLVTVPPRRLDVALSDSLVTVGYTAQDVWVLPFGEKVKRDLGDEMTVEARSEWDEGRLRVRRSVSGGASITETYMPSADGMKLTVAVEVSGGPGGGFEFRRVYDRRGGR